MADSGVLNIRKPPGVTSRQVVNRVAKNVRGRRTKVGHAGTLDPLAQGVLVVCYGAATRLIEFVQQLPKSYTGEFELGKASDTEDAQGNVETLVAPPIPTRNELESAAAAWVGEKLQRPPAYSALKVDGVRAHQLARSGEEVVLEPRPVVVHSLRVERYEYPHFTLRVECGKGTYIRSLGRDIGAAIGGGAIMTSLIRTAIGDFRIENAIAYEQLRRETVRERSLEPLAAVAHLPLKHLANEQRDWIWSGGFLNDDSFEPNSLVAAIDETGELVSVLRQHESELRPYRNLKSVS